MIISLCLNVKYRWQSNFSIKSITMNSAAKRARFTAIDDESTRFSEGAIRRIKLRNFLTYDYVEVCPGPNLNLIIGPNGTGKSTIVCAICLGLAGKPSVTGRAAQAQDYIKHGCNEAFIEIELHNPSGPGYVISREINDRGSSWRLDGRPADKKDVDSLVAKLNIQVTNLCQFLPQDRVAEFVRMSQQELLVNTQKAIGNPQMYEDHCRLKQLREEMKRLETSFRSVQDQVEKEKQKNSQLEDEVKSYHDRQNHLEKIKILKMKRPWVEYDNARQEYLRVKTECEKKTIELNEAKKVNAPLQSKVNNITNEHEENQKKIRVISNEIKDCVQNLTRRLEQIEKCSEKISELHDDLTEKRQEEEQRKTRLQTLKQQLSSLQNDFANVDDVPDITRMFNEISTKSQEVYQKLAKNHSEHENSKSQLESAQKEKGSVEQQIRRLQDKGRLKLELLRKINKHAYDGVIWLQNNRDKFSKPVYEPIMTQINVKDQQYAKYVENSIPFNDMVAFVCEDENDMDKLMSILRDDQGLNINAVLAPRKELSSYQPPQPIQAFQNWGFQNYLKDLIEAPEAVMKYLCELHRFHGIPVGNNYTKNNVEGVFKYTNFRKFFTENHSYTGKQSRYANNFSTLCQELRSARLLTISTDLDALNENKLQLKKLEDTIVKHSDILKKLQEEKQVLTAEQEKLRNEKKAIQIKRDKKKNLKVAISQKEESIKRLESNTFNLKEEERKYEANVLIETKKKCKILKGYATSVEGLLKKQMEKLRISVLQNHLMKCKHKCLEELHEANASLQSLQQEVDKMKQLTKSLKSQVHEHQNNAWKVSKLKPGTNVPIELRQCFNTLPETVEEIDDAIHHEEARADCLIQTDENVISEFKQRKRKIGSMEEEQNKKQVKLEKIKREMEEVKQRWLSPLQELISKVNSNFAHFFTQLGCAGEVSLNQTENPDDFDRYGICIKVKYRSTEPLRELTSSRQSGGERSVATVLYMMALQELTCVPFRCVDEINQGMDSENERRVFDLIVKTACNEHSAQYFLLTPKLLSGLMFSPNMMILQIHNGEHMVNSKKWSLRSFIERRKNLEDS